MRVGGWELERALGSGRLGQVLLAHDETGRAGCLRRLDWESLPAERREAALDAARRLRSLDHPSIAGVLDIVDDVAATYVVTRHVPGPTLRDLCDDAVLRTRLAGWEGDAAAAHGVLHAAAQGCVALQDAALTAASLTLRDVIVGSDGVVVLIDAPLLSAVFAPQAQPADAARAWYDLALVLRRRWTASGDAVGRTIERAASRALPSRGAGDLGRALRELERGAPADGGRRQLAAAAELWLAGTDEAGLAGRQETLVNVVGRAVVTPDRAAAALDQVAVRVPSEARERSAGQTAQAETPLPAATAAEAQAPPAAAPEASPPAASPGTAGGAPPDVEVPTGAAETAAAETAAAEPVAAAEAPVTSVHAGPGARRAPAGPTLAELGRRLAGAIAAQPRRRLVAAAAIGAAAVVAIALVVTLHGSSSTALGVRDVRVLVRPHQAGCGATVRVSANIDTNGGTGTIDYTWSRNGQSIGGIQHQPVSSGQSNVTVPDLTLPISGQGILQATVVLDVLRPGRVSSPGDSFTYVCTG